MKTKRLPDNPRELAGFAHHKATRRRSLPVNQPHAWLSGDEMRSEFEGKLRAGLESAVKKMNLVSREEYDVQVVLLDRLRKKLSALERRLDRLENGADEGQPERSPDDSVN